MTTTTHGPSPRSRCATCKRTFAQHAKARAANNEDHAFVAKVKPRSRTDRWMDAVSEAQSAIEPLRSALEALNDVRQEYEEWHGNLPENLQGSTLGEKLENVINIDIESAIGSIDEIESAISDAESAELPRGFGND